MNNLSSKQISVLEQLAEKLEITEKEFVPLKVKEQQLQTDIKTLEKELKKILADLKAKETLHQKISKSICEVLLGQYKDPFPLFEKIDEISQDIDIKNNTNTDVSRETNQVNNEIKSLEQQSNRPKSAKKEIGEQDLEKIKELIEEAISVGDDPKDIVASKAAGVFSRCFMGYSPEGSTNGFVHIYYVKRLLN